MAKQAKNSVREFLSRITSGKPSTEGSTGSIYDKLRSKPVNRGKKTTDTILKAKKPDLAERPLAKKAGNKPDDGVQRTAELFEALQKKWVAGKRNEYQLIPSSKHSSELNHVKRFSPGVQGTASAGAGRGRGGVEAFSQALNLPPTRLLGRYRNDRPREIVLQAP
jgi:hypothetical protein